MTVTVKPIICILFFFLLSTFPISSIAFQTKRARAQNSNSTKASQRAENNQQYEPSYAPAPFDWKVDTLPFDYMGNDVAALYRSLERIDLNKSEFETTEQYLNRVKATIPDHIYAFKIDTVGVSKPSKYNADLQELDIELPSETISGYELRSSSYGSLTAVPIKWNADTSPYTGKSKRGITKRVEKIASDNYQLVIDRGSFQPLRISVPLSVDYARKEKYNLEVLLICQLNLSLLKQKLIASERRQIKRPTVSDPRDYSETKKYITVELEEIWIYNPYSGEILKKQIVEEPPFEFSSVDIFEKETASLLSKDSYRYVPARVGEVIQKVWHIDRISGYEVEITNLRSGIHHRLSRGLRTRVISWRDTK